MVPRNYCTNASLWITLYKRSDIQHSFTRQMNDKHKTLMIVTWVQHELGAASLIEVILSIIWQPIITCLSHEYQYFLYILSQLENSSWMSSLFVMFVILLSSITSSCTFFGIHQWMVPKNECTSASLCISLYKRSDIQESRTGQINDKHNTLMIITRIQHEVWDGLTYPLILFESQPNMAIYDHLLVPRVPAFLYILFY